MNMLLTEDIKIVKAINASDGAAGTTDVNGDTLDTQGFDGVMMLVRMGAITATAVTSIKAQQGDASNLSDAADVSNSSVTIADDDDDKYFAIDIQKPAKRYVRVVADRGTANAVVEHAIYVLYKGKVRPSTNGIESVAQIAN